MTKRRWILPAAVVLCLAISWLSGYLVAGMYEYENGFLQGYGNAMHDFHVYCETGAYPKGSYAEYLINLPDSTDKEPTK